MGWEEMILSQLIPVLADFDRNRQKRMLRDKSLGIFRLVIPERYEYAWTMNDKVFFDLEKRKGKALGAVLAFDVDTLYDAVTLIEKTINEFELVE